MVALYSLLCILAYAIVFGGVLVVLIRRRVKARGTRAPGGFCYSTLCEVSTDAEALAEVERIRESTSLDASWRPCGTEGCHYCEIAIALRHGVVARVVSLARRRGEWRK